MLGWRFCVGIAAALIAGSLTAAEPKELSSEQAEVLGDVIDAALVSQWDASRRGFAKGTVTTNGAGNLDAELTMAWEDERVRYQYLKYEHDRNPPMPGQPARQQSTLWKGSWSPKEHWQYDPARNLAAGLTGRFHRDLDDVLDLRPRRIWFGFLMRGAPTHVERFRQMRPISTVLEMPDGNIVYRAENGELEFSKAQDYRVVRHQLTHPKNPTLIRYELAQDSHRVWFPKEVVFTKYVSNSASKVDFVKTITISEYTSRPAADLLKFSIDDLGIAKGTLITSMGGPRSRTWTYGVNASNAAELRQIELDKVIEKSKASGFSAKSRE